MKLILRYLKPFALLVLLCFALLFGQAICDLSLPNLMSDIVSVGIQQGGIDDPVPEAISAPGMQLLSLFMTSDSRAEFFAAYSPAGSDAEAAAHAVERFPALATEDAYLLNESDPERLASLHQTYGTAAFAFITAMQEMADMQGAERAEMSEMSISDVSAQEMYALLPILSAMPEGSFDAAISAASGSDSTLYEQIGAAFTRLLYQELGADLHEMQQDYIFHTGVKMLLVTLAAVLAAILVGFFASRIAAAVSRRIRHDVFCKVESFSNAEFDRFSTASLITRTTNDVQQTQMLIVMGIRMMCYAPIMGIGGVIMALGKCLSMSWIIALAVCVMLGLILIVLSVAMPRFKSLQKLIDRLNLVSRENLSGLLVIRAFGNEEREEARFERANRDLRNTERFVQRMMSLLMPVMMLVMNGVSLLIVWVGGNAIADATIQLGDMMAFIQYAMQIIASFLMIAMMFIIVPRASVSAVRINEVLRTTPQIRDPEQPVALGRAKGVIRFDHVSFRYGDAEKDVLHDITFTARPGETTAFIGATGSGKSTLINLIPRFYDTTEGTVSIDGIDVRALSLKELRDNIGYVPQKGILFSGDIRSNVRYGRASADDAELNEAIRIAQAQDFVDSTGEGLDYAIAQGGDNVSGGQKQRLAIARALVKKAPIYVFDDSFSALDFKTDAALRRALRTYTQGAAVLLVAQRVSTIMSAEQIIVLDHGRIEGIGTHRELLENCPIYREIAESQLSKEELE